MIIVNDYCNKYVLNNDKIYDPDVILSMRNCVYVLKNISGMFAFVVYDFKSSYKSNLWWTIFITEQKMFT